MNSKKSTMIKNEEVTRFQAFNPLTRKYETVYECDELPVGTRVMKIFKTVNGWVTIPGDCIYVLGDDNRFHKVIESESE